MSLARTSDLSYLNLEGPSPETNKVPVGTKSPLTHLRRIALKDIKNDPSVNSGLKRPLGSLKRRMSDSECPSLLQCKSKLGKVDLETDKNYGFTSSKSEQNMNSCTTFTNTPLARQDKERNESAAISSRSVLKNKDGIVVPVPTKPLPPVLHGNLFSPLDCYSTPKILDTSYKPMSCFTDISAPFQEQESAEGSSNENKFFSTPMPSKTAKKKLTPLMEVDSESNMSEEWQPQDKVSRKDLLRKNCADVLSIDSPTRTPLYRSSFATECQDIIKHIKGIKPAVRKSPSKWKVEEVDVSSIDAEPPPYDSTPMKSMLACEVAKVIASLESSPVKEGPSLCGESLLALDEMDILLNDFNFSNCSLNRRHSLNDELSLLSSRPNSLYLTSPKMEKLEKTDMDPVNKVNKNVLDRSTPETLAVETLHIVAVGKCGEITSHVSNNLLHTEDKLSDNVTEPAVMMHDTAIGQVVTASRHTLVGTTGSLAVPVREGAIVAYNGPLNKTIEHKKCANTTHDFLSDEEVLTNATFNINKASIASRPSSTSIHEEITSTNATHVIETSMLASGNPAYDCAGSANTTHDIGEAVTVSNTSQVTEGTPQLLVKTTHDLSSMHKSKIADTTHKIEVVMQLGPSKTLDSVSVLTNASFEINKASIDSRQSSTSIHEEMTPANVTHVIETSRLASGNTIYDSPGSTDTTHDIGVAVTVSNTSQVTEGRPQLIVNTSHDLSMHKSKIAGSTQELEVVMQSCPRKTLESVSVQGAILMANTSQFIEMVAHGNRTHEISSSCPQDVGGTPKSSVEVLSINEANPNYEAVPEKLGTSKESMESPCNERVPTNGDHPVKDVVQPMDLDVPPPHNIVIRDISLSRTTGINVEITTLNTDYDLAVGNKDLVISNHRNVSELDPKQMLVNDEKLTHVKPTQASVVGLTHVTVDPSMLISPTAQAKRDVIEGCKLEECEKNCQSCTGMVSQKVSESCNLIQEEENTHDVSAFSVGSLSFITSTPVPGLNNFPFQKTCRESVQLDSNLSTGSVLDDSTNKVPGKPKTTNCNDQAKEEASLCTLGGRNDPRSMVPSDAVPKPMPSTSGIPSVRRSLVPYPNAAKDPIVSKIPARGIPGKGMIRPTVSRLNLPRQSLVNPKPVMDGPGGSSITNKFAGNGLRPPKAAAVKAKSNITHSQLPTTTPSVKLPSRLGAPGTTGRQNAAASAETTSVVRPPISTGIRTALPRPGTSSTRPPLQQSQKVSPKLKSQVQGLLAKKSPKGSSILRRETGPKAASACILKSSVKPATLAALSSKEAGSLLSGIRKNSSANSVQTKAENHERVQSSMSSNEDLASILASSIESAESAHGGCQHLEKCKCCHTRYQQLLQENEELKRRLGQVQPTPVEMPHMPGT